MARIFMSKNKTLVTVACAIFLLFLAYWLVIALGGLQGDTHQAELYSALYGLMALFGGVVGLGVSRHWGGYRSMIGRSVLFMALGLLAQELGQVAYSGYTYIAHQEIPYPSLGDIGYFGSVILYILASYSLMKALSTKNSLKQRHNQFWIVLLPLLLLSGSFYVFLRGYHFNFHHPITILLDFGYPLGQAFYLSLTLLAYVVSRRYLGGIMKPVILFFLFALLLQGMADFTFLYQVSRNTWKTAGWNELLYLLAYFTMTLSLINFRAVATRLSRGRES